MEVIFIDDNAKELDKYSRLFDTNAFAKSNFNLHPIILGDIQKEGYKFKIDPDLFLIDFRFDLPGGEDSFYNGYVLATAIRSIYSEAPIFLFTRKDIFNVQKFPSSIIEIVDDILYKSDLLEDENRYLELIYSVAAGYQTLSKISPKNWNSLLATLNVPMGSVNDLFNSNRPIGENDLWTVIDCAKWIRKTLLKYPGILYNEIHSSTFLGISLDVFFKVKGVFDKAKYNGLFTSSNEGYYWKSLLMAIAVDLMNKHNISKPIHLGFSEAFKLEFNEDLEPSICVTSGEPFADKVCYILNKPIKTKYSLVYNVDNRTNSMDEARVSWKAIRTTNEVKEDLLNPIGREILNEIKKGK